MDTWSDRLSEYLDGDLDAATTRELETHLAQCAECRATLDELRRVVTTLRSLPDREPARDGWSSLRGAIEARQVTPLPVRDVHAGKRARTFVVTAPQAAAAALLVALGWGGSLYWARNGARATVVASAVEAPRTTPVESPVAPESSITAPTRHDTMVTLATTRDSGARQGTARAQRGARVEVASVRRVRPAETPALFPEADYAQAVADLENMVEEGRGSLDTATVRVLEQSLRTVDHALRQAREALARDPNNSYLNDYLAQTMKRKLELLRRAADIVQAQT